MLKNYFYCSILIFVLGCGETTPMPSSETYRTNNKAEASPLSNAWKQKLNSISDQRAREDLASNIKELTASNRDNILEILNNIPDKDHELRFLQDLSSFDKTDQRHLINILLHLQTINKPLILKLASCPNCLSLFEKLKLYNIIHDLDKSCQHLIEQFEEKLEEEV